MCALVRAVFSESSWVILSLSFLSTKTQLWHCSFKIKYYDVQFSNSQNCSLVLLSLSVIIADHLWERWQLGLQACNTALLVLWWRSNALNLNLPSHHYTFSLTNDCFFSLSSASLALCCSLWIDFWWASCKHVIHVCVEIQWNLSIKDLWIKDTSLIRTLPLVPAT